jgi:hypothetical protein
MASKEEFDSLRADVTAVSGQLTGLTNALKEMQESAKVMAQQNESLQKQLLEKETQLLQIKHAAKADGANAVQATAMESDSSIVNLALALSLINEKVGCDKAKDLLNKVSESSLQTELTKAAKDANGAKAAKQDLPSDLLPIPDAEFGPENALDYQGNRWLKDNQQIREKAKGALQIEDKLVLIQRLHESLKVKLTEKGYMNSLELLLSEAEKETLDFCKSNMMNLAECWSYLYKVHQSRLTRDQAEAALDDAVTDMTTPVRDNLNKIRRLMALVSTDPKKVSHESVRMASKYLGHLIGESDVSFINSIISGKQGDEWSEFLDQVVKNHLERCEKKRQEILTKQGSGAKMTIKAIEVKPAAAAEPENRVQALEKVVHKLCSQFGQMQKNPGPVKVQQVTPQFPAQTPKPPAHAPGPNPHVPQHHQTGYRSGGKTPFYPPLPPHEYAMVKGKCRLCSDATGVKHRPSACPVYPGVQPLGRLCPCLTGCHPPDLCKRKDAWPPSTTTSGFSTSRTQYGTPPSQGFNPRQPGQDH